jgi:hypothetical protein
MPHYAIFTVFNGALQGIQEADTPRAAFDTLADNLPAELAADSLADFYYYEVTGTEADALERWWNDGADASLFPIERPAGRF